MPPGGTVLVLGCSSGYFLDALRNDYEVYGAESSVADAEFVRSTLQLPCEEGTINEVYPGKMFTAIVAFNVLPQQADPMRFLYALKNRLIGGGWLYLELPSHEQALIALYDIPEFRTDFYNESWLTYWDIMNLSNALAATGFEATVTNQQETSLHNHLWWLWQRRPMDSIRDAIEYRCPVGEKHPLFPFMARFFYRNDKEYRLNLETAKVADTLVAMARRREI